jgi:FAD/FMN-containing dehydrogenase
MAIASIDPAALDALRAALPGRVVTPSDAGYDAARAGFSLTTRPTPAVIVVAEDAGDIVAAVDFARAQGLPAGVKATGHNFAAPFDGGLLITTERMQSIQLDPVARTARVEAGVRWGPVVQAAHAHGLAPLNGSSPTVGVVGYTLYGGFGWLLRKYGAAVDSVLAADVVTADGRLRRASPTSNSDLFWALRGGSGNFGIVTALEFALYPVRAIYGGALFWPLARAEAVLTAYSRLVQAAPDELASSVALLRLPPLPHLPEFLRGQPVITVRAAYVGAEAGGAALLQPLRAIDGLIADTFRMMSYPEAKTINADPTEPAPAWRTTMMLKDLAPATITALLQLDGPEGAAPVMNLEIRHLGGAMTRLPDDATAFNQRRAPFILQTVDVLLGGPRDEVVKRHTRAIAAGLRPHATGGVLPSWLGDGDYGIERTRAGFSPAHYARLAALKRRYDPTNLFRLNHNIPPAADAAEVVPAAAD